MESALGGDHPRVVGMRSSLAFVLASQERYEAALTQARQATRAIGARAAAEAQTLTRSGQESRIVEGNTGDYRMHLMALAGLARQHQDFSRHLG